MRSPRPVPRMRPAAWAALAGLILAAFVQGSTAATPSVYVAMGDSFTSGGEVPPYDTGTNFSAGPLVNNCMRSPAAYPRLINDVVTRHVACAGAVTANLTTQGRYSDEPGQGLWVTPATTVVSVLMGLNDIGNMAGSDGYGALLRRCWSLTNSCAGSNFEAKVPLIQSALTNAIATLRSQAPAARFLVLEYPQLLPASPPSQGCRGYSAENILYIRSIFTRLNDALAFAAGSNGATIIHSEDAFAGHDLCSADPWATDSFMPPGQHPNAKGHTALAALLRAAM